MNVCVLFVKLKLWVIVDGVDVLNACDLIDCDGERMWFECDRLLNAFFMHNLMEFEMCICRCKLVWSECVYVV